MNVRESLQQGGSCSHESLDRTMEFEKLDEKAESMLGRLDELAENSTTTKKAVLSTDSLDYSQEQTDNIPSERGRGNIGMDFANRGFKIP